ncbi:MAG: phosphate ABC transporter permease PstA [Propionibacteriaceae bacterium]|jgi:phosphate transport system permease protein|nr:phosphate ABC transporter permease PstA [Propionibacteriaceae bacterium]
MAVASILKSRVEVDEWRNLVKARPRTLERRRRLANAAWLTAITGGFFLAVAPLVSVLWTVVSAGLNRMDAEFFTSSMRGVIGAGGGALHAIMGTVQITLASAAISVPVGILAAVYLVEYGRGAFARTLTLLVDVMTGIPSIVAGLFAFALFSLVFGPGMRAGIAGAIALSLLMTPVVIRSTEEMLRLVPVELREAAQALGAPKYRTITQVVLPTAASGISAGVMLGISRIVGETAPLLLVAGFTDSMNYNMFSGRMASLPVFIYSQWQNKGIDAAAYDDRAWSAALTLIGFVFVLNLASRMTSHLLTRKSR